MTEEQIRAIVRDEMQEELLKVGGVYDHTRRVTFNMVRQMAEMFAQKTLEACRPVGSDTPEGGNG